MQSEPMIVTKQEVDFSGEICLFVSHSLDCSIKPHVVHHVSALMHAGFQVILIYNTDKFTLARRVMSFPSPQGIIVRQNEGYDFGAWADVLRLYPALWNAKRLLLTNDSIIGPAHGGKDMFARLRGDPADLVGLVESLEIIRHFQSFSLLLNRGALDSQAVRDFWASVVNLKTKKEVIRTYELTFTSLCRQSGLTTKALFRQSIVVSHIAKSNPTVAHWRALTKSGFLM